MYLNSLKYIRRIFVNHVKYEYFNQRPRNYFILQCAITNPIIYQS